MAERTVAARAATREPLARRTGGRRRADRDLELVDEAVDALTDALVALLSKLAEVTDLRVGLPSHLGAGEVAPVRVGGVAEEAEDDEGRCEEAREEAAAASSNVRRAGLCASILLSRTQWYSAFAPDRRPKTSSPSNTYRWARCSAGAPGTSRNRCLATSSR